VFHFDKTNALIGKLKFSVALPSLFENHSSVVSMSDLSPPVQS
jgi:hypothetical protein